MLIPLTSAKIAWWHRMLVGNKKKGVQFLSNVMYIEPWAKEAIDDGGLVTVAYDPNTPNRNELIQIIENAGYGARAANVIMLLQLGLGADSDWATIVNNADIMTVIWGNANTRELVLNLPLVYDLVIASSVARGTLFANLTALGEVWNRDDLTSKLLQNPNALSQLSTVIPAMNSLLNTSNWDRVVVQPANITPTVNNLAFFNQILGNPSARARLVNSLQGMTAVGANNDRFDAFATNTTYRSEMFDSANAIQGVIQSVYARTEILGDFNLSTMLVNSVNAMTGVARSAHTQGSAGALVLGHIHNTATLKAVIDAGDMETPLKVALRNNSTAIFSQQETKDVTGTISQPFLALRLLTMSGSNVGSSYAGFYADIYVQGVTTGRNDEGTMGSSYAAKGYVAFGWRPTPPTSVTMVHSEFTVGYPVTYQVIGLYMS